MKKFGVDVGGTTIKIGLFDETDVLEYKCEIRTDKSEGGKNILGDLCAKLSSILEERKIKWDDCLGVGIGLPGPVTDEGDILGCVNLGWGTFNVEEELSKKIGGIKVKAGNDANVAALGEQVFGGGKGYRNLVMVTLGTGVGGGVIVDGKLISGTNGAAGEIGHIPVNIHEKRVCSCGKRGCLEQYASATGIVALAKEYIGEELDAKTIFDRAKENDEECKKVTCELGKYLGMALAAVASVTNPDCMVIGGGVSKAGKYLIDLIEKNFMEMAFLPCRNVEFRLAALGNDAGMYGAAALIR